MGNRPVLQQPLRPGAQVECAIEFQIVIDRTVGQTLGVDVDFADGVTLKIDAVTGGLVKQWNDNHPELAVKPRDRIVEVNGIRNDVSQLVEECKQHKILEMVVQRQGNFNLDTLRTSLASAEEKKDVGNVVQPGHGYGAERTPVGGAGAFSACAVALQTKVLSAEHLRAMRACGICKDDFVVGDSVKTLPCGHVFHDDCMEMWGRSRSLCKACGKPWLDANLVDGCGEIAGGPSASLARLGQDKFNATLGGIESGEYSEDPAAGTTVPFVDPSSQTDRASLLYRPGEPKWTELRGPYIFGYFSFFVDDVLKLKDAEGKCVRAHCLGPVMKRVLLSPVIHCFVMHLFMVLGGLLKWIQDSSSTDTDMSYPIWWFLLAGGTCCALMCHEVQIAKYSSTWYSDKARMRYQDDAVLQNVSEVIAYDVDAVRGGLEFEQFYTTRRLKKIYAQGSDLSHCLRCSTQVTSGIHQWCRCGNKFEHGRLPIGWPCLPVKLFEYCFLNICPGAWTKCHEHQAQMYFNVWFTWSFGLGTVTLYSRLSANTFLGMLFYSCLDKGLSPVSEIWEKTLSQSPFMGHFPLWAILLMTAIAQICHYAFGVLSYFPRRRWGTADHKRWQYIGDSTRGKWADWGRSFEFGVKGVDTREENIADSCGWERWKASFEGGQATVRSACGKIRITGEPGGPVYNHEFEYNPSDADLPVTVEWDANRHAYTSIAGDQMTSSTVMDGIAECCSMNIMMDMQLLDLMEWVETLGVLHKYEVTDDPTERMAGELIAAVRTLMNDAANLARCAVSRIFIYGVCFAGLHLQFQVTYANALCSASESCRQAGFRSDVHEWLGLCVGIGSAFVSMVLVLCKVYSIRKYLWNVWRIFRRFQAALISEHADLVTFKTMQDGIDGAKCRLFCFSCFLVLACLMFVQTFLWVFLKWIMETHICEGRMWKIPAWVNIMNIRSGCVV